MHAHGGKLFASRVVPNPYVEIRDTAMRQMIDGQQTVVINRPGANGSIAVRAAAEAAADGYTFYLPTLSTFVALPTVAPKPASAGLHI